MANSREIFSRRLVWELQPLLGTRTTKDEEAARGRASPAALVKRRVWRHIDYTAGRARRVQTSLPKAQQEPVSFLSCLGITNRPIKAAQSDDDGK
jgi:hypothetical protein